MLYIGLYLQTPFPGVPKGSWSLSEKGLIIQELIRTTFNKTKH
jgi:hypothetical protein